MSTKEIANRYVALCKERKNAECIDTLFADDAESVEALAPPGGQRAVKGKAAIHAKSKWWADNHIVHEAQVDGPYPHDDRFAVHFVFEITHKPSDKRFTMKEVGLFTVQNDKITREEFFYQMG
jgi:SnoaL-like domain